MNLRELLEAYCSCRRHAHELLELRKGNSSCVIENSRLLDALAVMRRDTITECANNLSVWYPDNVNTNAFCAALRSMLGE